MKTPAHPLAVGWNVRRWTLVIALVFALEVSLVFVLSWRPGGSIPAPARVTTLRFATTPQDARRLWDLPWLPDAAQFAQVTPRGFTAPVWNRNVAAGLPWPGWREPPRWLEASNTVPSLARGSFFLRAPLPWVVVADRTPPRPQTAVDPTPLVPTGTTLSLEGELRQRRLLRSPELPVIEADDILPPTVVQVVVGDLGNVISATLQPPGSGVPEADEKALQAAWKLQFEPVADGAPRLSWGRVVVRWASRIPPGPSPPTVESPS